MEIQYTGMDDVGGLLNWIALQDPVPVGWTLQCGDDNEIYWDNRGNELRVHVLKRSLRRMLQKAPITTQTLRDSNSNRN